MSDWLDGGPPPATPPVDIRITREGTTALVYLVGELDLGAADRVTLAVHDVMSDGSVRELVFDLAGVSFCDSSGIAILIKAWHDGQAAGVPVSARTVQPRVAAVLHLTGVWSVLSSEPLTDDARQYLDRAGS